MTEELQPLAPLRSPETVMRLSRLGSMFPTRLSFLRILLRRISEERATVERPVWAMDQDGYGHAIYKIELGGYHYSLVAFSNALDPADRTDRVIAEAWDCAFVLYDGIPDGPEIERMSQNAPHQEAGRFGPRDLVLSRANKSVRYFEEVVAALISGQQPDAERAAEIGYLMRTTAVYGNGKFGIADRARLEERPVLDGPFMVEMLAVWMIRGFTHDLVEHVGGSELSDRLKRLLGVGNSTGLGMAPFLVSHPELLSNWMMARETALARIRALPSFAEAQKDRIEKLAARADQHLCEWSVPDKEYTSRIAATRAALADLREEMAPILNGPKPGDRLVEASMAHGEETEELIVALLLEAFPEYAEPMTTELAAGPSSPVDPRMSIDDLKTLLARNFAWVSEINFDDPFEENQFWYVSAEKLEPRLGKRFEEPGAERETPLDIARQIQALSRSLKGPISDLPSFLAKHPEHREAVRRVQISASHPYSEIRDNLISAGCRPIDMLRAKLAQFGASKFDPKSDLWTRITLAQGAPLFNEFDGSDDWWLPVFNP